MTKKINPKQKELRRVTAFLISVSIILILAVIAIMYFSGNKIGDVYTDELDYTNQSNFSYDVTRVDIGRNGATLKNNNDQASVILLNPLRISDKYQGDIEGRILEFNEVADKAPGAEIYYQLSGDEKNWQYYGSGGWENVDTCTDCYNTAPEVSANIEDFVVDSNALSIKVLLVSSDNQIPVLKSINLKVKGEDCSALNRRAHGTDFAEALAGTPGAVKCAPDDIECLNGSIHDDDWDRSSVSVTAQCIEPNAVFTITNTGEPGEGDMDGPSEYRIYRNDVLEETGSFQLAGGASINITVDARCDKIRLEADQRPGHPGNSHPRADVEDCGCEEPYCGDGNLDPGEECDDGNNVDGDGCSAQCTVEPFCGDGNLDPGEECDDGNNIDGDGCSATCTIEEEPYCGDGILNPDEQCDDGNNVDGDGCSAKCTVEPFCGDGNVDEGEECDDGNKINNDFCNNQCKTVSKPYCGDGIKESHEECDDGNNIDGDGCSSICKIEPKPFCGDGNLDEGEECDDGNNLDGDGCSAICTDEPVPFCGDGNVDEGEECDDGNNIDGDGCSSNCTTEPVALVVPTTLTLPTPEPTVIVPDAIGFDVLACGLTYTDENITFSGYLNGPYDENTILEYTLSGGKSWTQINNVDGLGTGAATFSFTLSRFPSGVYDMTVRALLADGTTIGSVNCPFSIDLGDLIFGANEFVLHSQQSPVGNGFGSQQGPMNSNGVIQFRVNEPQEFWIEAKAATSFIVDAYEKNNPDEVYKTFELKYDENTKLWTGTFEFPKEGIYRLIGTVNGPGGSYSREINTVLVSKETQASEAATITVYEKQVSGEFDVWNGQALGQQNPLITESGMFAFVLPEGEYYIKVTSPDYPTLTSRITKISDQSFVTADIDMEKWNWFSRLSSLVNRGINNFKLDVTAAPAFALLQVGDLMPAIEGTNEDGERYDLLQQMGGDTKVLMAYSDWNKEASEQLEIWTNIIESLSDSNNDLSFAALGTMPPLKALTTFNERGGYDLNFFKPDDIYHDNYHSISLPHFFVLDHENALKGMIVGSYPAGELSEMLTNLINQ